MSVYTLNRICHQVMHDRNFRAAMQDDPVRAIRGMDLTDTERRLLIEGEVGQLHLLGVNAFLLGYLTRFGVLGLGLDVFNARMRAVADRRPWARPPGPTAGGTPF